MEYLTFNKEYFKKHQNKILFLLNFPLLKVLGRYLFRIDCKEKLHEIAPNYYTIYKGNNTFTTDFRTHWKYSKRLYYSFKPIWWLMHAWDWVFADKVAPQLSFGFNTLTAYPQAGGGGGNVTCDGWVYRNVGGSTFAGIRDGAGTTADNNDAQYYCVWWWSGAGANTWDVGQRGFFTFDTSSLTAEATINSALLSLYGVSKTNGFATPGTNNIHLAGANLTNANNVVTGDYNLVSRTSFASITYASFSTTAYNVFTLNASGHSNINKTGVSQFSSQSGWDIQNSFDGNWTGNAQLRYEIYYADQAGTTTDPKLVIDYTLNATRTFTETPLTIVDTNSQFIKTIVRTLSELLTITDRFKKFLNGLVAYWTNKFSSRSTTWSDKNSDRGTTWTSKY